MTQTYDTLPQPDLDQLSAAQRLAVQEELQPDEVLIWIGQPSGRIACPPAPVLMVYAFFTIPLFIGLSQINRMFWYGMGDAFDIVTLIISVLFIMASLSVISQPWRFARLLGKVVFLITDQRVISLTVHRRKTHCQKLHYVNIQKSYIHRNQTGYHMIAIEPVEEIQRRDFPVLMLIDIPGRPQVQQLIKDFVRMHRNLDDRDT